MSKISEFPELTRVNTDAYLVQAFQGRNYKRALDALYSATYLSRFSGAGYRDDFWNSNQYRYPWNLSVIGAGTLTELASIADHPGLLRISQNGANTGAKSWLNYASNILLAGYERTDLIFRLQTTTNLVLRFGFGDNFTATAAPTDGVWIDIAGATLTGKTRNNSAESTTASSYASATATWYRAKIVLDATAARVDFYLFDAAGAQLWTDSLTTNIPTASGRETSHGVQAYKTTAGVLALVDLDLMTLMLPKGLNR